jgi:YfiH family protein
VTLAAFLRAPSLEALGIDHGLGTLASEGASVPGLLTARQVHGTRALRVPPPPDGAEADALVSTEAGVAVAVYTADCVPMLVAECEGRGVAVIHAGWRGSAGRIAEVAVAAAVRAIGCTPADLVAVIGPHIGPCCYEVDAPVRAAIEEAGVFRPGEREGHWQLDLGLLNRLQLERAGVPPARIAAVGGCTACDPATYASYRRDGTARRMLHYVRVAGRASA